MPDFAPPLQRRRLLALAAMGVLPGTRAPAMAAEVATGWVQPRLATPPVQISTADGRKLPLLSAVVGKVTAVQLMFTGCSTSCPIQGAFFAAVASRLQSPATQLLSVSIDALGDTPAAMTSWQARFGKSAAWRTAVADVADVHRLVDFMKGTSGQGATHTAQVFVLDQVGQLAYRTGDSPSVGEVEALLARVAQRG